MTRHSPTKKWYTSLKALVKCELTRLLLRSLDRACLQVGRSQGTKNGCKGSSILKEGAQSQNNTPNYSFSLRAWPGSLSLCVTRSGLQRISVFVCNPSQDALTKDILQNVRLFVFFVPGSRNKVCVFHTVSTIGKV